MKYSYIQIRSISLWKIISNTLDAGRIHIYEKKITMFNVKIHLYEI